MNLLRALAAPPLLLLVAAAPSEQAWTVFGLELGKPIAIPVCPKEILATGQPSAFLYDDDPSEVCHEPDIELRDAPWRRGAVNFPLRRMPLILHFNTGHTLIIDGRLEGLQFETLDHTNTETILGELTAKFGPATSINRTVGGPKGVGIPAIYAEWKLPDVYVSYRNIDTSVEYGTLEIETPTMQALRRQREAQQARERTAL